MSPETIGLLIALGVLALFIWANVNVANRKGFNPWAWVLAAGPLGLVILYFLPSAAKSRLSQDQVRRRVVVGNSVGLVLSGVGAVNFILLMLFLFNPDPQSF